MIAKIKNFLSRGSQRSLIVKKNIIASLLIKGCSIIVSLLLVPLTLDYVSSEMYGIWLTLSSIMLWLNFFDVGFTLGLKNRLAEAIAIKDWNRGKALVSTTYFMMVVIFVPLCLLLELLIPHLNWASFLNVDSSYNADISHCGYQMVFPNGRIDYYYNTGSIKVQDNEAGVRDLLTGNFVEPGLWNKLYRKTLFLSFFNKVKMDYSIKINEDLLMNYYLLENHYF